MKRIGKIGEANIFARRKIAEKCMLEGIEYCEARLPGCTGNFGIAPAHRHPREWYRKCLDKLWHFTQWIAACQHCHEIIDNRSKMTADRAEKIFMELRGPE